MAAGVPEDWDPATGLAPEQLADMERDYEDQLQRRRNSQNVPRDKWITPLLDWQVGGSGRVGRCGRAGEGGEAEWQHVGHSSGRGRGLQGGCRLWVVIVLSVVGGKHGEQQGAEHERMREKVLLAGLFDTASGACSKT